MLPHLLLFFAPVVVAILFAFLPQNKRDSKFEAGANRAGSREDEWFG